MNNVDITCALAALDQPTPAFFRSEGLRFDDQSVSREIAIDVLSTKGSPLATRLLKDILASQSLLTIRDA